MHSLPPTLSPILIETQAAGFGMASDILTGALLRTLAGSKPGGNFLELGTGTGLATSWILDGMDHSATIISIDNDAQVLQIAEKYLGQDKRIRLVYEDAGEWISNNSHLRFDYIFADTWHGKYLMLEETIALLNPGGFFILDDMLPQPNWPEGHDVKSEKLRSDLLARKDLHVVNQDWATGIMIGVKK